MDNIELIVKIENETFTLDYSEREDVVPRVFKRQYDAEEIENLAGDYTLNLTLPRTKLNERVFKYITNIAISDGFDALPRMEASVVVGAYTVINGDLIITKFTRDEFEAVIVGNNIAWKNIFRDRSLRDLTGLRRFRFSGFFGSNVNPWANNDPDTVTIAEVWQTTELDNIYDIQFPAVSSGNYSANQGKQNPLLPIPQEVKDSSGVINGAHINRNGTQSWFWDEFRPSVYLQRVFRSIFLSEGYEVVGSFFADNPAVNILLPYSGNIQKFYDSFNWALFGKSETTYLGGLGDVRTSIYEWDNVNKITVWPVTQSDIDPVVGGSAIVLNQTDLDYSFRNSQENRYEYVAFTGGVSLDSTANSAVEQINLTGYSVPSAGTYGFDVGFELKSEGTNNNPTVVRFLGFKSKPGEDIEDYFDAVGNLTSKGAEKVFLNQDITTDFITFRNTGTEFTVNGSGNVEAESGEFIKFGLYLREAASLANNGIIFTGTNIQINPSEEDFDVELNPAKFLPDVGVTEFITSFVKLYNLYISVDETNKIVSVDVYDNYFLPQQTAVDLSDRCNIDNLEAEKFRNFKEVEFKYQANEEEVLGNPKTYDFTYRSDSRYATDKKEIEVLFTPSFNRNYLYWYDNVNTIELTIPTLTDGSDVYDKVLFDLYTGDSEPNSLDVGVRLLRWNPLIATVAQASISADRLIVGDGTDAGGAGGTQPAQGKFNYNYYNYLNVGFWPRATTEQSLAFSSLGGNTGLFRNYYEQQFIDREKSIKVTIPVFLTAKDVESTNLRRPVVIDGNLFYLLTIDGFNPASEDTTDLILYKS